MRFVGTILFLTIGSVGGTTGVAILASAGGAVEETVSHDAARVLGTLEGDARKRTEGLSATACRLASLAPRPLQRGPSPRLAAAAASVGARLAAGILTLPVLAAAMLLGVLAGLLRRHRLRERQGFASLTFSYLGKQAVAVALAFYALVSLSPLAPPPWGLYVATVAAALGGAFYVGNLPPKL
jgi:hypothetical protein